MGMFAQEQVCVPELGGWRGWDGLVAFKELRECQVQNKLDSVCTGSPEIWWKLVCNRCSINIY